LAGSRRAERLIELLKRDPEARGSLASKEDVAFVVDGRRRVIEYLAAAFERFAARRCLDSLSYAQVWGRAAALASGASHRGLFRPGDRVAIVGVPLGPDAVIADLACFFAGAVSILLPATLGDTELLHIFEETATGCILTGASELARMRSLAAARPSVQAVISLDDDEIPSLGRERGFISPFVPGPNDPDGDPLRTIVYTSGSTGTPKGVLNPDSRFAFRLRRAIEGPRLPMITLAYLPLSHGTGRMVVYNALMSGGTVHFVSNTDLSTLFEDIRRVRPTHLTLVPRVSGTIYQHFRTELLRRSGGRNVDASNLEDATARAIIAEMRSSFLGDRVTLIVTTGAATPAEVRTFLEACFDVPVLDGYGSAELGMVSFDGRLAPEVEYKLVDVPELGYSANDRPFPRGELLIRSSMVAPGYVSTELQREADGWIHSGDIMEERGPRHLAWIDRRNNIVRLAQAEFVSISRLEELYTVRSLFVRQIYIYANPERAYVLAVVVPDMEAVRVRLGDDPSDLERVKAIVGADLERIARDANLKRYEIPRDLIIETVPFTRENGLLTDSNKPRRGTLKVRYRETLDAMYASLEAAQVTMMAELEDQRASVEARVRVAVCGALGLTPDRFDGLADRSFVGLGGDSLSAVRLSAVLQEHAAASPSVAEILSPDATISELVREVLALRQNGDPGTCISFDSIHGRDVDRVHANDLSIDRFSEARARSPITPISRALRILLTGANGLLGRFVLLELLERVAARDGEVVCVVRAASDARARARLDLAFRSTTRSLEHRFRAAAQAGRLRVLAGDVMEEKLGLDDSAYEALSTSIDTIVHGAALVNHALPYRFLFQPNVVGTAHVLELAIAHQTKAIHFLSTTSVASRADRRAPVLEKEGARELWPSRPIDQDDTAYAVGYVTSKWASEVLLQEHAERYDTAVGVYRCSMVLPHREYLAQANGADQLMRLLYGLQKTGLAPDSFYAEGYPFPRHYDGVPVDLVAAFIAARVLESEPGMHRYHVSNAHWGDGVSLDRIVGWMVTAGYDVARLPFDAWLPEFRRRLEALPERERSRSPLAILHRWGKPFDAPPLMLDTAEFRSAFSRLVGVEDVPILSEAYVHHCLRSLEALAPISES
jgi:fatty acid CoA ligase FadD9